MYIKISRNDFISRTGNTETHTRNTISVPYTAFSHRISVPKTGLTKSSRASTYSGGSNVSGDRVNGDNDDLKPSPMHTSTQARVEPMTTITTATTQDWVTVLQLQSSTELPYQPSSLSGAVAPSFGDEYESPTTTSVFDTLPSPSAVDNDSASTPTPWTTTSPSPVSTPTYLAPVLGTPIVQGPASNPGNGTTNATNQHNSQSESSKPVLSGGATAAISVVAIMVALALGLWLYKKWSIRKRKKKLADWWLPEPFLIAPNSSTRPRVSQVVGSIPRVRPPSMPLPPVPVDQSGAGAVQTFSAPHARVANIGLVRCVFEPRMADELRIRAGEALRILAEYDDGWGFCENVRGERGMIPLECLEGENISSVGTNAAGLLSLGQPSFARSSARKSSLLSKNT